jgi:outer membrane lipoprotein-sorting protein
MNILRRLPLSRVLLLCGLVVAIGISATALASALSSGPTPAPKPLAAAVHDALAAPAVQGVSASVKLTNHLLEGANLAGGDGEAGQLLSSPLLAGASGRLWIAADGRARLELQAEKGDTQILYDGHTAQLYDASTNTLYRYTLPPRKATDSSHDEQRAGQSHEVPSLAKIEEAISHVRKHAQVSAATPTDVAGQPAYTVRISPRESGSLFGGVELSWDAVHGVPLRAALYSSSSSAPVIELAATEIAYGPVDSSVFDFSRPPGVKIHEITRSSGGGTGGAAPSAQDRGKRAKLTTRGHGITSIAIIESASSSAADKSGTAGAEELPKVSINGTSASELATPLGTALSFERSGVRYLLLGSVAPAAIEAVARGL